MMSTTRTHSMNTRSRSGALKAAPAFQFDPFCEQHGTDSDEEYTPPPTKKPRPTLVLPTPVLPRTVDPPHTGHCIVARDVTECYEWGPNWEYDMGDDFTGRKWMLFVSFDKFGRQERVFIDDEDEPTGKFLYTSTYGWSRVLWLDDDGAEDRYLWRKVTLVDTARFTLPSPLNPNRPTSPVYEPPPPSSPRYTATSPPYDPNNPHPPLSPACPTSPVYNPRVAECVDDAANALMALSSS